VYFGHEWRGPLARAIFDSQAELKEARRSIGAMRPCFRVRLASRAITRFYDDLLVPSGLRVPHFVVLVGVFRGFGTMLTALGGVLGMDRTSLSKALRPLLRRGFVMRVPTTDRRRWTLQATRRGERLLARTIPYWQRSQQQGGQDGRFGEVGLGGELRSLAKAIGVSAHHQTIGLETRTRKGSSVGALPRFSRWLIDWSWPG